MQRAEEVAKILLGIKAVTIRPKKPFRYASGILSPIYCDNRLLLSYPSHRKRIAELFLQVMMENRIEADLIAGVATAGIPHATMLADRLDKPLVYVRAGKKGHGKQGRIEGRIEKGQNALVIEDHITTGGSSAGAVKALQDAGCKVEYCLAITTYGLDSAAKAFADIGCKAIALTGFTEIIEAATKLGYMKQKEKEMVLEWNKDPRGWGEIAGFE